MPPSDETPASEVSSEDHATASFEAKAWLAAIVENSDDAIVSKTLDGRITTWNAGATRLFGHSAAEAIGQPVTMLIPEERLHEEEEILSRLRRGERVDHFETVRRHRDGGLLDVAITISPVRNAAGEVIGASKIARDISELKKSRAGHAVIVREMNHRIKNIFSLIGGLLAMSARSATDAGALASDVQSRVQALAKAHELTQPDLRDDFLQNKSTTLATMIRTIVTPHGSGDMKVAINGEDVPLTGTALTSMALLFHEIATNAAKYGALSATTGSVQVDVRAAGEHLVIDWRESGGPAIAAAPSRRGFGSVLEEATLRGLRGRVERDWDPVGLRLRLTLPMGRIVD